MSERLPARAGEWINRNEPLHFRFEGRQYSGFQGDTISSALWANGVKVLGRSFKYHRPRGIFSLADIDCNAMLESETETNIRADVTPLREGMDLKATNTQGGVLGDRLQLLDHFGKFTPVGFYYKAFHTPSFLFPFYERRFRQLAGLGQIKEGDGSHASPKDYAFADLLIVGAGPAGLAAAREAASSGLQVLLVDENPHPGGSLCYQHSGDRQRLLSAALEHLSSLPNLQVRRGTTVVGWYADQWSALVDEVRLTKLRTRATLFATGCYEQPAVFRNNDLPGVMLASAAQRLIHQFAVKPFSKAVVLTANPDGYQAALDLLSAGVEVSCIVDMRHDAESSEAADLCRKKGISIANGQALYEALPGPGKKGIRQVSLCTLGDDGLPSSGPSRRIDCDGVAVSVGWAPADSLLRQARVKMEYDPALEQYIPVELPNGIFCAGRVNGVYELSAQIEDGQRAGREAARFLGTTPSSPPAPVQRESRPRSHPYPVVPHPAHKNFVDLDEDLQLKDLENGIQEAFDSPELLKRYSTFGMGPSQGKHSNLLSVRILSHCRGDAMAGKQLTTARPFTRPVTLGALAGRIFTPLRRTPTHSCHQALGAKFMYAGNWLRPEYYPQDGLSRQECIRAEVDAVRNRVGLIDLGTLGKLEISGPDVVAFLERIYTGLFTRLPVGMTRYGVMCDESGVIIDDGVLSRLDTNRFYVSTTSTGSDAVYRELQRWALLWRLNVTLVNATSHFGAMNLAGPNSRELLQELSDIDLSPKQFPYMAIREGRVAGVPARLTRVGFVGELGYEIHLPGDGAVTVWDALMEAGRRYEIRPFAIEAQRLLRLEKSHIILGQDTDGLTHPAEAGLHWAVKMDKPFFVGKRSLEILAKKELTRKLVGFVLPEGYGGPRPKECHLVIEGGDIAGRVTSVAESPTLEQVIGLAYVRPHQSSPGSSFQIRVEGGHMVNATVVKTPFYDAEGSRQEPSRQE